MNGFRKRIKEKGFTLIEALIALGILAIGLVGLQTVIRQNLVSSVRAWDKLYKTNIALSRLEEHKAQLFNKYVPNMPLPVIVPVSTGTGVDFVGNTLIYTANVRVSMNGLSNTVTSQTGYSVTFSTASTPSVQATYYYGNVDSVAGTNTWNSVNGRAACDTTLGNIYYVMDTPPNINGTMALWFVDYQAAKREQRIWMNNYVRQTYASGSISSTPTAPTTLSFPITRFDTATGPLTFRVEQMGSANRAGAIIENGTNQTNLTVKCGPTATFTPTTTGTPLPICNGTCNQVDAYSNAIRSGNYDRNSSGTDKIYPTGAGGTAKYVFDVNCPGDFLLRTLTSTNDTAGVNNNLKVTLDGDGVFPLWTDGSNGVTAIWYPDPNNAVFPLYIVQDVRHVGTGTNYSNSSVAPAVWEIIDSGPITMTFYSGNAVNYPRTNYFCLVRLGDVGSYATPTPTVIATATNTPAAGAATFHVEAETGAEPANMTEGGGGTYLYYTTNDTTAPPSTVKDFVISGVPCGTYKINSRFRAPSSSEDSWYVEILGYSDNDGSTASDVWDLTPNNNTWSTDDVNGRNGGGAGTTPIREWNLTAGSVTIRFGGRENNAQLDWFELIQTGTPGSCPTNTPTRTFTPGITSTFTPTFTRTNTFTPTATATPTPLYFCTFPTRPTPVTQGGVSPNYVGTPTFGQFGCDNPSGIGSFLSLVGKVDTDQQVGLFSGPVTSVMEGSGKVLANVRLIAGSSVTFTVVTNGPTTLTGNTTNGGGQAAWVPVTVTGLAAGTTITQYWVQFGGSTLAPGVTHYLALDSVRTLYDVPLNPNAVLTGATLAVMDSYRDTVSFSPYIVDSSVIPLETPGTSSGYQIQIVVHNGRNGLVTDTFAPVTLINSVSP
jgi:prepilin-type N-terminal cleavage/methylation domain-containing protein